MSLRTFYGFDNLANNYITSLNGSLYRILFAITIAWYNSTSLLAFILNCVYVPKSPYKRCIIIILVITVTVSRNDNPTKRRRNENKWETNFTCRGGNMWGQKCCSTHDNNTITGMRHNHLLLFTNTLHQHAGSTRFTINVLSAVRIPFILSLPYSFLVSLPPSPLVIRIIKCNKTEWPFDVIVIQYA